MFVQLVNKLKNKTFIGSLVFAATAALPSAFAGQYGYQQPATHYKGQMSQQFSTDNPRVQLPHTLPNWLLIPQTPEPLVEAGVGGADGYAPILIAGTPVVSAPYYGVQTEFQGDDLLVNAASINKDLALLLVSQNFYKALTKRGEPIPSHPIIELSGLLEAQIVKSRSFEHDTESDINLTAAELDIYASLNPWVTGFMQIEYDDGYDGRARRVNNSRVKVGTAFINFGNLDVSDFYLTIGQVFVPFGQYSSSLITNSFAKTLGRTKQRAGQVGYYHAQGQHSINAAVYAFSGDTDTGGSFLKSNDDVNGVGGNLGYHYDGNGYDVSLGASIINNLAESDGMQRVFGMSSLYQRLEHQVPAIDLRAIVKVQNHKVIAEYVGATRSFDRYDDLAHNNHGARPEAFHAEYVYDFDMLNHPASVALGYDHSWDALAIGLPEDRVSAVFSVSPWRNTVFSVEYRYDEDYDKGDVAGLVDTTPTVVFNQGSGNCAHTVTAQFDLFF